MVQFAAVILLTFQNDVLYISSCCTSPKWKGKQHHIGIDKKVLTSISYYYYILTNEYYIFSSSLSFEYFIYPTKANLVLV